MIDRDQGLFLHQRNRLRRGEADDDAADQARAGGGGDAVDLDKAAPGVAHGGRDDHIERLYMGARRDLRHHAAEGAMLVELTQHDI